MSVTLIAVAPSITWLLVRISPVEVSTMPVPAEVACSYPSVATTSTRLGSTRAAIWLVVSTVSEVAVAVFDDVVFMLPIRPPTAAPAASATTPVMASPRLWLRRGGGGGALAKPYPGPYAGPPGYPVPP